MYNTYNESLQNFLSLILLIELSIRLYHMICIQKTNQEMDIIECKKIMLQLIAELQSVVRTRLNCLIIQNAETIQCRFV